MPRTSPAGSDIASTHDAIIELNRRAAELLRTDPERARMTAEEALAIAGTAGAGPGLATTHFLLGQCALLAGRYDDALVHADRARGAAVASDDRAQAATLLGALNFRMSRYAEAIEQFQLAARLQRELGDTSREAGALGNLGLVHHALGDYARALECLEGAMRRFRDVGDRQGEAFTLGNIGVVYNDVGDVAKALEHHQRALELLEADGDRVGQTVAHNGIGIACHRLGRHDQALSHFARSLELATSLGNRKDELEALDNRASVLMSLGRMDEASETARAALELAAQSGDERGRISPQVVLGRIAEASGNPGAACAHFEAAIAAAIATDSRAYLPSIHRQLASCCRQLGRLADAIMHLELSIDAREELFNAESDGRVRRMQARYDADSARAEAEIERLRNVELAEALNELKHAETQLVHSEKMASLGQLTAGIAHEINNPVNFIHASTGPLVRDIAELASILARVRAWKSDGADASTIADVIDEGAIDDLLEEISALMRAIEDGAARTAEIVRGLRNFSHIDENDVKRTNVHDGLDATLILLSSRTRDAVDVDRRYGELPEIECYPGQINQVFMNILANAIDAMGGSGRIVVTTSTDGGHVQIGIRDDGPGMSEDVSRRIFDPFFTTKEVGKGTGLGLSISYRIIEAHGGTISVSSAPGEGSEFIVRLPVRFAGQLPSETA